MNATWTLILASFLVSFAFGAEPVAQRETPDLVFFGATWWEAIGRFYPSAHIFLSPTELKTFGKHPKRNSKTRLGVFLNTTEVAALSNRDLDQQLSKFKSFFEKVTGQQLTLVAAKSVEIPAPLVEALNRHELTVVNTVAWTEEAARSRIPCLAVDTTDYDILPQVFDFAPEYRKLMKAKAPKIAKIPASEMESSLVSVTLAAADVESSPKSLKSVESATFTDLEASVSVASSLSAPESPKSQEEEEGREEELDIDC